MLLCVYVFPRYVVVVVLVVVVAAAAAVVVVVVAVVVVVVVVAVVSSSSNSSSSSKKIFKCGGYTSNHNTEFHKWRHTSIPPRSLEAMSDSCLQTQGHASHKQNIQTTSVMSAPIWYRINTLSKCHTGVHKTTKISLKSPI